MSEPTNNMAKDTAFASNGTPRQQRAMRHAILAQCFGILGLLSFQSNLLLVYFASLGISSSRVLTYLSLPVLIVSLLRIPLSLLADRIGKKRLGTPGLVLTVIGFAMLAASGGLSDAALQWAMLSGIVVFSIGTAMMEAGWFALLSPIVPEQVRGRFFGRLRMSWQLVGVLFFGGCAVFLSREASRGMYQVVLGLIAASMVMRVIFYMRLPEMEKPTLKPDGFRAAMASAINATGYISFCAYVFLLSLCTMAYPMLFGLIEKKVLGLGDNQVVWLGSITAVGAIAGFFLGGKAVDRFGTRPVFLICHFGYALVGLGYLLRDAWPGSAMVAVWTLHFLFGVVMASSSIAITSEMLALIPAENKSLTTSICNTLYRGGHALSAILAAWALDSGMLNDAWTLAGLPMSGYDSILLLWSVAVVVLVVTLGLVPSVIHRAQWVPGQG
jgi:MFS family permease